MIDYTRGYAVDAIDLSPVNVETWASVGSVTNITAASVSRSRKEQAPLLETASLDVDGDFEDGWYRLSVVLSQGGHERVNVGTFLFEASSPTYDYGTTTRTARGSSVLKPVSDQRVLIGEYAPKGADGAAYAASLIRRCTPAPVEVETSFTLGEHVVFGRTSTCLQAVWAILDAGGACIQIDGEGVIHIMQVPTEPSLELSSANAALLLHGVSEDYDVTKVPNRLTVYDGARVVTAVNQSDGPTSIDARGRIVDETEDSPATVEGETLEAYATRRLRELRKVLRTRTYGREWVDGVVPWSVVRGTLSDVGLDGDMSVLSQEITIGAGVYVSKETAVMEVTA